MKILIVSDAWYPQVNGVVRTLATVRDELVKLGHSVEIIGPDRFRTVAMPTYPEIRLAVGAGPQDGGTDRGDRSRRHPHRDRRAAGLRRPRMVPEARHPLHDRLSHPLSGICPRPRADPAGAQLCPGPPLPRAGLRRHGGDQVDRGCPERQGLPQHPALVARRRYRPVPPARQVVPDYPRADLHVCRPRRGGKEPGSLPEAGYSRHQGRRRRRSADGGIPAALSGK